MSFLRSLSILALALAASSCSFIKDFDDFEEGELCTAPLSDCDTSIPGCEDPMSDRNHCGGCGIACGANELCDEGVCERFSPASSVTASITIGSAGSPHIARGQNDGVFIGFMHQAPITIGNQVIPATNPEGLVVRFNAGGALNWALGVNGAGSGSEYVNDVASSSAGVYAVGQYGSDTISYASTTAVEPVAPTSPNTSVGFFDGFVWALDEAGVYRWHLRVAGVETNTVRAVTTDGSGNVYIAGEFSENDLRFGSGINSNTLSANAAGSVDDGFFVAKLLSNGGVTWSNVVDAPGSAVEDIAVDEAGNLYVFSTSSGTVNADAQTNVGNATPRIFRFLSASGALDYFRPYATAEPASGGRAAVTTIGARVFVAFFVDADQRALGSFPLSRGLVVAELDPATGDPIAVFELGESFEPRSLGRDVSGNLVLTGVVANQETDTVDLRGVAVPITANRAYESFVAGFTAAAEGFGTYRWAEIFGSESDDAMHDLATSPSGAIFISGGFEADVTFQDTTLTYVLPNENGYVMRLQSAPVGP